jgi:hypothetical protein
LNRQGECPGKLWDGRRVTGLVPCAGMDYSDYERNEPRSRLTDERGRA